MKKKILSIILISGLLLVGVKSYAGLQEAEQDLQEVGGWPEEKLFIDSTLISNRDKVDKLKKLQDLSLKRKDEYEKKINETVSDTDKKTYKIIKNVYAYLYYKIEEVLKNPNLAIDRTTRGLVPDIGNGKNTFYSAVTKGMVASYMNSSPFKVPNAYNNKTISLNGGSTANITSAIKSLSSSGGGTLKLSGTFTGNTGVFINGVSNVRILGNNAIFKISGGRSFGDDYSGFVVKKSSGISIEGITIYAPSGHGILVWGGCNNIRVTKNYVRNSKRSSIIFYSDGAYTNNFEISGNRVENFGNETAVGGNSHHGIVTRYSKKGLVIGNLVDGTKNVGRSRMGMDISTSSWYVEAAYNKIFGTNYGSKIGYGETKYVYFHNNYVNAMNDEGHGDRAFYIHRTLGGPVFVENNIFWDQHNGYGGSFTITGAGSCSGEVYTWNNKDINGKPVESEDSCSKMDKLGQRPPANIMNVFKTMGN